MWSQTIRAFRRRWYLLLAGLILTAGLGLYVEHAIPPTYQISGSMLLLPSESQTDQGQNPFLELDGLETPADFVVSRVNGGDVRSQVLGQEGPNAGYEVEIDSSMRGPVILATAYDRTVAGAQDTLERVLVAIPQVLYSLQAGLDVPRDSAISVMRLVVDDSATELTSASTRAVVAATGIGVVLTLAGTVAVDALLGYRRRWLKLRRERGSEPALGTADADAPDAESADAGSPQETDVKRTSRKRSVSQPSAAR